MLKITSGNPVCVCQAHETQNLVLTILDMQPRVSGGGSGKSSDDIVFEMAARTLDQLLDKLDIEEAKPDMFEVSSFFTNYNLITIEILMIFIMMQQCEAGYIQVKVLWMWLLLLLLFLAGQ